MMVPSFMSDPYSAERKRLILKGEGSVTEMNAINKIHDIYYEYLYIFIYV